MRPSVPSSIKCLIIHRVGRVFRETDSCIAAEAAKRAVYAFGVGEGGIEERLTGNTNAINFNIGRDWFDTIKREFIDLYVPAALGRLARQPLGASLIGRQCTAMNALSVISSDPPGRPVDHIVREATDCHHWSL